MSDKKTPPPMEVIEKDGMLWPLCFSIPKAPPRKRRTPPKKPKKT